ncbi:hypothetical protein ACWD5V_02580 [Streptomyces sp. NPDC002523]
MITHITPQATGSGSGLRYDRTTALSVLPVHVHHDDGPPTRAALFLDWRELALLGVQVDAVLDQSGTATVIPMRASVNAL